MVGTWQAQPLSIDGYDRDWPQPFPNYDDKALIGYAISNDKDNLYIAVETGDLATQLKILQNGFTVWIDKTGRNEKKTAIHFPLPQQNRYNNRLDRDNNSGDQPKRDETNSEDRRRMALIDRVNRAFDSAIQYSLQGFKGCNSQFLMSETDTCGIFVKVGIDSTNELVWEAKIPFSSFYNKQHIDKRDLGKTMGICVTTNGVKRPDGVNSNRNNHSNVGGFRPSIGFGGMGGMGVGMSMGSGRGMHGSSRSPQTNSIMEPLYKNTETSKKFSLAYHE